MTDRLAELFDNGTSAVAVGDLEAAVLAYEECVKLDPEFFDGWHALGMTRMKNGDLPGAIAAGLEATRLRPNDQLAWSSLSLFYARNGQIPEAEAAGAKARILSWGAKLDAGSSRSQNLG
ncbi:MAG: tetratricopeptide repeat protein, partial [Verrucomicrobiia bacterium]